MTEKEQYALPPNCLSSSEVEQGEEKIVDIIAKRTFWTRSEHLHGMGPEFYALTEYMKLMEEIIERVQQNIGSINVREFKPPGKFRIPYYQVPTLIHTHRINFLADPFYRTSARYRQNLDVVRLGDLKTFSGVITTKDWSEIKNHEKNDQHKKRALFNTLYPKKQANLLGLLNFLNDRYAPNSPAKEFPLAIRSFADSPLFEQVWEIIDNQKLDNLINPGLNIELGSEYNFADLIDFLAYSRGPEETGIRLVFVDHDIHKAIMRTAKEDNRLDLKSLGEYTYDKPIPVGLVYPRYDQGWGAYIKDGLADSLQDNWDSLRWPAVAEELKTELRLEPILESDLFELLGRTDFYRQKIKQAKMDDALPVTRGSSARDGCFICYSHQDSRWLEEIKQALAPATRTGKLRVWDDTMIRTGLKWREEIKKELDSAKVALLLESQAFLASDFIDIAELPVLLEAAEKEGLIICRVPFEDCLVNLTPIHDFQAVWDTAKPLGSLTRSKRKKALNNIVTKIIELMDY